MQRLSGELDQNWLNLWGMIMHGSQQVHLALCTQQCLHLYFAVKCWRLWDMSSTQSGSDDVTIFWPRMGFLLSRSLPFSIFSQQPRCWCSMCLKMYESLEVCLNWQIEKVGVYIWCSAHVNLQLFALREIFLLGCCQTGNINAWREVWWVPKKLWFYQGVYISWWLCSFLQHSHFSHECWLHILVLISPRHPLLMFWYFLSMY